MVVGEGEGMSVSKFFFKKTSTQAQEFMARNEKSYRYEIVAIACCMMLALAACSLASYDPSDATLLHMNGMDSVPNNWCGALGANMAALLFYLFGAAAYLLLTISLFPVYMIVLGKIHAPLRRLSALLVAVVLGSIACAMYRIDPWETGAGGNIGMALHAVLKRLIGVQGSAIVVWCLLSMSLALVLRIPIVTLVARSIKSMWWWVCWWMQAVWSSIKGFFAFKRVRAADVVEALDGAEPVRTAGIVDDVEEGDECILKQVQDDKGGDENAGAQGTRESGIHPDTLSSLTPRTASEPRTIMKWNYLVLPNSVLKKNMFAGSKSPAKKIKQALGALVKHFALPTGAQFNKAVGDKAKETDTDRINQQARQVEEKLHHFGVKGNVVTIKQGPVVTMFEYKPEIDSKVSKIVALEDDLTMALSAQSMRVIAPLPGKNAVGFEIANAVREDVLLATLLEHETFAQSKAALPVVLGVDSVGVPVVEDLAKMPHLLVGGSTGSGKSVGLNTMLVSLLCKRTPDEMSLILVDPKRLEFTPYAHIPHLLFPIVTQPSMATKVLGWVVQEMERRYQRMAEMGMRTFKSSLDMKYLVVIIDELADLMMVAGKEVESHLVRLAQMARAAGIHLIVATQRPSVDVVTGLIKVNFPSRIAFRVSSKVDSRTILDSPGAERLLGRGDMLFMHSSSTEFRRVHGAYVADSEIERVADFVRSQRKAEYMDIQEVVDRSVHAEREEVHDELYPELVQFIQSADEISISMIQRHYRIGFNRSARLIEKLEMDGYLAPSQGAKPRKVIR